jgi:hypothetical protein
MGYLGHPFLFDLWTPSADLPKGENPMASLFEVYSSLHGNHEVFFLVSSTLSCILRLFERALCYSGGFGTSLVALNPQSYLLKGLSRGEWVGEILNFGGGKVARDGPSWSRRPKRGMRRPLSHA